MKYKVFASSLVMYVKEVEAINPEQAEQIAFEATNNSWEETGESDWQIDRAELIEE